MQIRLAIGVPMLAAFLATAAGGETANWTIFSESFISSAHAQAIDWQKIDDTLGRKPAVSGDVHRYGFPRSDLTVTLVRGIGQSLEANAMDGALVEKAIAWMRGAAATP